MRPHAAQYGRVGHLDLEVSKTGRSHGRITSKPHRINGRLLVASRDSGVFGRCWSGEAGWAKRPRVAPVPQPRSTQVKPSAVRHVACATSTCTQGSQPHRALNGAATIPVPCITQTQAPRDDALPLRWRSRMFIFFPITKRVCASLGLASSPSCPRQHTHYDTRLWSCIRNGRIFSEANIFSHIGWHSRGCLMQLTADALLLAPHPRGFLWSGILVCRVRVCFGFGCLA